MEVENKVRAAAEDLWTFERIIRLLLSTSVTVPSGVDEGVVHQDSNSRIDSLSFGALSVAGSSMADTDDLPPPYSPPLRYKCFLAELYLTHRRTVVRFVGAVAAGMMGGGAILTLNYVLGIVLAADVSTFHLSCSADSLLDSYSIQLS